MARKNTVDYNLLKNQSLSADFVSPVTLVQWQDNVSYQINITTSNSTGTFSVEVSNDYAVNEFNAVSNPGTWAPLVLSGVPTVAAANDIIDISLHQVPYKAIRLSYDANVAGTGTCSAWINCRQVGG